MARPDLEKRSRKTPASKTTSKVAKPNVSRVTRSETLRRAAIAQHNSNSPLLRLPAEIRNQIYDYVIGGQTYVVDKTYWESRYWLTRQDGIGFLWRHQTALSRTCRQFRHDTSVLPFQKNSFTANYNDTSLTMNRWMCSLQPYHASAIQTILWGFLPPHSNLEALELLLAEWVGIKRAGVYRYNYSSQTATTQKALETAGFEFDDRGEDSIWGYTLMWYERS